MKIWLTVAEASRYSGASKERVRRRRWRLHDASVRTAADGRLRVHGDGY